MIAKTVAKATKQCAREERGSEERRCERLKGQCELSKLAVVLGDATRGRRERREKRWSGWARRRELRHLWCSQGNGKVAIAGRTRLAIGGLMCRGEGGTNKAGSECFKHCCVGDKSMNKGLISEDRSNKATLLLTVLCSLLSRLQRIYRSQYFD